MLATIQAQCTLWGYYHYTEAELQSTRLHVCTAGGRGVDVSVYEDVQVDARTDGIQRLRAHHLSVGISSSLYSRQLLA